MKSIRKIFRRRRDAGKKSTGAKRRNSAPEGGRPQAAAASNMEVQEQDEDNRTTATPGGGESREDAEDQLPEDARDHAGSEYLDKFLEGVRMCLVTAGLVTKVAPFPGSEIVFDVLESIVENVQGVGENGKIKKELQRYLSLIRGVIFNVDPSNWPEQSRKDLYNFKCEIVEQLKTCTKFEKSLVTGFIFANLDKKRLSALEKCISNAVHVFQIALAVEGVGADARMQHIIRVVDEKVDGLSDAQAKLRFEQSLRNVTEKLSELAAYDALRPRPIDTCYKGTCDLIREKIKVWATCNDDNGKQVMWLSGLAGTGKSTLAKTIATWADKEKKFLGSSYFFLRGDLKLGKPALVIPTIAYHLSRFDPTLTEHIEKNLEEKNGYILHQEITEQFRKLIEEPLAHKPEQPRKRALLIVDGLDECEDGDKLKVIVNLLLSLPSPSNSHIRVLLVSRPEKHILKALHIGNRFHPNVEHLAVEHYVERSDIETYLRHGISEITKSQIGATSDIWPEEIHFQLLVDSCGKLFIYASTVIGFIDEGVRGARSREESLNILLSVDPDGASDEEPYKNLDSLYQQILLTAVGGEKAKPGSKRVQRLRKILEAIVSLRGPLGIRSISILFEESEEKQRIEEKELWDAVKLLSSVLIVPVEEDHETPIRVFHPSLLDFLADKDRCDNEKFFVDMSDHVREGFLFRRCLEIIVSKGLSGQVNEKFFQVLEYVCVYWGYHLEKASHEAKVAIELETFARDHLLKWFRFVSVIGSGSMDEHVFRCLEVAQNWVSGHISDILGTLNGMLRSGKVLQGGLSRWVPSFTYDAARSKCGDTETRRGTCHPGTRVAVLEEIKEWATSASTGPSIFWLHGSALTGKSAVAMSIAEWADEKGILGSGFFFRDVIRTSLLAAIVGTISHDLASFNLAMRGLVVEALEGNEGLRYSEDAELQFNALIAKPLLSLKQDSEGPILLIIDGLDWCEGAGQLLTLFFTHLSGPDSSHIRILIMSRPTPDICNGFEKHEGLHRSINLDEVPAEVVRRDIETYLHDGLARIHKTLGSSTTSDWNYRTDLDSLVNDSNNSFLYAKYALKFIGNFEVRNPVDQLQNWLLKKFDGRSFKDMYPHCVAELAISAPPEGLLLFAICISQDTLPLASLAELLQTDTDILRTTLPHLYPFIISDTDDDLRPSHSSLRTFCATLDADFVSSQHAELCCLCLGIMIEGLNIVFENSNRINDMKKADERNTMSRPALRYACRYWATILSKVSQCRWIGNLIDHLDTFIRNHLLSWLYVMALLQLASETASMMHTAYKWSRNYMNLHVVFNFHYDVRALTKEAWHFAEANHHSFAKSPLQVYRAVLSLPENSRLRPAYKEEAEERLRAFEEANRAGAPEDDISSQS